MNLSEDLRAIYRDFAIPATFEGRTVFVIRDFQERDVDPGTRGGARFVGQQTMIRFITADLSDLAPGKTISIEGVQYKTVDVSLITDGLETTAELIKIK